MPPTMADKKHGSDTTQFSVRLSAEMVAALEAFIESLDPPPSRTAVITSALRQYLEGKGFWPPR